MKLVPDWRQAWRWWSLHASALGVLVMSAAIGAPELLLTLWNAMPAELRGHVPERAAHAIALVLFVGAAAGRLIKQRKDDDDEDE